MKFCANRLKLSTYDVGRIIETNENLCLKEPKNFMKHMQLAIQFTDQRKKSLLESSRNQGK